MKVSLLLLFFFLFIIVSPSQAKLLPQLRKTAQAAPRAAVAGIWIAPKLNGARNGLTISFSNLQNSTSVRYVLTYQTNGKDEGVSGSVDKSGGNSATRDLTFGTCSSGVCTYHGNITNMKLEVTAKLTSGRTTVKKYRIKV